MTADADIYLTISGPVAELVLNRPAKRNALSLAMWRRIPELLERARTKPEVRALFIRGAGGVFSAGADISEFEATYATPEAALNNHNIMMRAMQALEDFPKPTIAVIEGPCVGGGCGLALCCDIRIASDTAIFGVTPAQLGLSYGLSDTRRLVQAVGFSQAKTILFTAHLINAQEALRIGLVDKIAAAPEHQALGSELADEITANSSYSMSAIKSIFRMLREGAHDDNDTSRQLFANAFAGSDFKVGASAFLAKRRPRFL